MRITAVEPIVLSIPFTQDGLAQGFLGSAWSTLDYLLVRVDTDAGWVGWGEAFGYAAIPGTRALLERVIGPAVLGLDASDINGVMDALKRPLHIYGRAGPMQYAISGLDIALWDLAGKVAGMPVWRLLGGSPRATVPAYSSLLRLSEPAVVAQACERAAARGFTGVKLHELTVEAVAAARSAVGSDVSLMLDVNCPWSASQAVEMGHRLRAFDLAWLEEPVWPPEDLDALAAVGARTGIPVATGENIGNAWGFGAAVRKPDIDIVQPSVTKVGGITEFVQVGTLAALANRTLTPHSPYFGPGLLATLQMAAVFPTMPWIEFLGATLQEPVFGDVGRPGTDGRVPIPTAAGLGADPDPQVITRYRVS